MAVVEYIKGSGFTPELVRLAPGLEHIDGIIDLIEQALEAS
jgi:cystathionine beta-lyase/cystathionine gamma-synthase